VSNLGKRLLTAAIGVPILLWLIYGAPGWAWIVFIMAIAAACGREYYRIVGQGSRRMLWLGPAISSAVVGVLAFFPDDPRTWATVAAALPLFSLLALLARPGELAHAPARAGLMALGTLYTGVLPALVAIIHRHDPHYVVFLLSIAFLGDTGAYTAGRLFGRHPLSKISPKKTWEGAAGGLAASAGAAAVASFWYMPDLSLALALAVGALGGAFGQLGDLGESMLKRAFDVKDSGRLLPGHGGMLDRVDGVLFTVAVLYFFILWHPGMP
jgi:phosphatidate cytidylyltransferase